MYIDKAIHDATSVASGSRLENLTKKQEQSNVRCIVPMILEDMPHTLRERTVYYFYTWRQQCTMLDDIRFSEYM